MKIGPAGGNSPGGPARAGGAANRSRSAGDYRPIVATTDTTSILGIPEAEFTPRVEAAITRLMAEADELRATVRELERRLEIAEQLADLDPLLPVYNRRAFVRELTRAQASARRYGTDASLVYLDLDQFKAINDSLGHEAGDYVLSEIVRRLRATIRETDIIGRLGGDEFGLILSRTQPEQAQHLLTRLTQAFHEKPVIWKGQELTISFSTGVVPILAAERPEEALTLADGNMYRQKKEAGRTPL